MSIQVERRVRPRSPGNRPDRTTALEPEPGGAVRAGAAPRRGVAGRRRPPGRAHRPAHRPVAQRQVRRQASRRARRTCTGARVNRPIDEEQFAALHRDMMAYLQDKDLFVLDAWAGTDPVYKLPIRVVTQFAWHNLFARNMFLPENDAGQAGRARARVHRHRRAALQGRSRRGTARARTSFIFVHFGKKLVLIGGTHYAGEIKKSIFTILNYLLPLQGVLSMHCSANIGAEGDTALFFGLSGTGKTTLSSDPHRRLIGDDEHGWSDTRRLQLRGRLLRQGDQAVGRRPSRRSTRRPGVSAPFSRTWSIDPDTRALDLDDASLTENTRALLPDHFIDNAELSGRGGHPTNIVMLTADAYGVLPPIARLTPDARDVPLPVRLHRQRGRHREGRDRAEGDVQHLLRRAVPAAATRTSTPRCSARRSPSTRRRVWLVNTGLDRRALRRRQPHEDRAHPRDDHARRSPAQLDNVAVSEAPDASTSTCRRRCPGVPDAVLDPRSTWPDRRQVRRAGERSWPRCSSTTSRPSRPTCAERR